MGVRPPQGSSSSPDVIEFGIPAVGARLDDAGVEFPASSEEIVRALDDTAIPTDGAGNTLDLEEALSRLSRDRFETKADLLDRLHPIFEEQRRSSSTGIVGRLRTLLPF
ncbi:DUF2795 domain-containing protein [Halegenticoccus soli]|uniref:DUF2795 domain-containing protein n=1 Tax=Halegenticoccus soli TaxID=1985678 RepID=UPI000C6E5CAE|nr:DUF2795 domain-containing protein [Halegenticoccus soli]